LAEQPTSLRFGLLCDGLTLARWQVRCLEQLMAVDGVSLELVVLNEEPPPPTGWRTKLRTLRNGHFLWGLFRRLGARRPAPAFVVEDVSERLANIPKLNCRPERRGRFSQHFPAADLEAVRASGVDFLLRFGFGILRGEILKTPRYGVWSFHHDDVDRYRGMPPGFWEIFHGDKISGAVLQRLTNRLDGGVILQRGFFRTIRTSYPENINAVLMGSTDWPAKVCGDLLAGAADYVDGPPTRSTAPIVYRPRDHQMIRFLLLMLRNRLVKQWENLFRAEQWNVGIVDAPIASFLHRDRVGEVRWLTPRNRRWFSADAFALEREGRTTILLEDYDHARRNGTISCCESDDAGGFGPLRPCLDLGVHMSYPYLFEHDGEIYCIPETHRLRQVRLLRAVEFPDRWEHVETLIDDFAALDATVLEHDGKWWMFCTDADHGSLTKLHIFWAPELIGPWRAHAGNPVKCDVRSSRPAGTPFMHEGTLIRPGQDSTNTYGGAIAFHRVLRLTETQFEEEKVSTLAPDPDGPFSEGLHTICKLGDRVVVDGKRHVFIRDSYRHALRRKLRRAAGKPSR